jgi:hypothetical protein
MEKCYRQRLRMRPMVSIGMTRNALKIVLWDGGGITDDDDDDDDVESK